MNKGKSIKKRNNRWNNRSDATVKSGWISETIKKNTETMDIAMNEHNNETIEGKMKHSM